MDQNFWPVIAQTAPVLALALVIEARAFARRVARDDASSPGRPLRVYSAVTTLGVAIALTVAFSMSMVSLARGRSDELWVNIALFTLPPAIGLVVLNPLLPLLASVRGEFQHVRREHQLEKSRQKQLRRLDGVLTEGEAVYRQKSLDSLSEFAVNFSTALRITRLHRRSSDPKMLALVAKMHSYLDEQERAFRELEEFRATFRDYLRTTRELRAEVDSDRYRADKSYYLKPLEDMIG